MKPERKAAIRAEYARARENPLDHYGEAMAALGNIAIPELLDEVDRLQRGWSSAFELVREREREVKELRAQSRNDAARMAQLERDLRATQGELDKAATLIATDIAAQPRGRGRGRR